LTRSSRCPMEQAIIVILLREVKKSPYSTPSIPRWFMFFGANWTMFRDRLRYCAPRRAGPFGEHRVWSWRNTECEGRGQSRNAKTCLSTTCIFQPIGSSSLMTATRCPLGDKTLKFLHTPWVHWPETMVSYLVEDRILFSCDFLVSHLATSDLYVTDSGRVYEAAKRYYAKS